MAFGDADGGRRGARHVFRHQPPQIRGQALGAGRTDGRRGRAAKYPFGRAIEKRDAPVGVEGDDGIECGLDDAGQALLALRDALLEALQRDVGTDAGQHLLVLEGLGDVVHGTALESLDLVRRIGQGAHEDHRDVAGLRALLQAPTGGIAVHHRHQDIEEDEVGVDVLELLQRALAILGDGDLEPAVAQ